MAVISIIQKSKLEGAQRIEAEYYQPNYIRLMKQLKSVSHINLGKIAKVWDGLHASIDYDELSPIYCLSAQSVKDGFFDLSAKTMISPIQHQANLRTSIEEGDIIISSMGTIGFTAVAYPEMLPANSVRQVLIVRPHNQNNYLSYYICAFLNSKYGLFQSLRESTGNVQQHLFIDKVVNFKIPLLKRYAEIGKLYKEAERMFLEAEALYSQAEKLLLAELGLLEWKPKHTRSFVRQYSEATEARRIDSQYFQPKFDELLNIMSKHAELSPLSKLVNLIEHGKQPPYDDSGSVFVFSQKHIGGQFINYDFPNDNEIKRTSNDFASKYSNYVLRENDIVHYSVGANIGFAQPYLEPKIKAMPGSFITLIRANEQRVKPLYLAFVLNTIVGRLQTDKWKSATAQPYIYPKDIKNFLIPKIQEIKQVEISDLVVQSHEARREANRLLQLAKRVIETAIEQDEQAALALISQQ